MGRHDAEKEHAQLVVWSVSLLHVKCQVVVVVEVEVKEEVEVIVGCTVCTSSSLVCVSATSLCQASLETIILLLVTTGFCCATFSEIHSLLVPCYVGLCMRQLWKRGNCKFHVPTFIQNGGRLGAGEKFIEIGESQARQIFVQNGGVFY